MNQKHYNPKKSSKMLKLLLKQEKLEKIKPKIKKTSCFKRFFNWVYRVFNNK